ncbi:MAG TPA: hypothetical protein VGC97_05460 [Pyrinomonadaceae bacterium]
MKIDNLQHKIRTALVAFSLLFGIGILSATTASAQSDRRDNRQDNRRDDNRDYNNRRDDNDRYDDDRNYNNQYNRVDYVRQQAYRNGYDQGLQDARSGRRANAQRAAGQAMRQMNNGNNSRWGNQRNSRQDYREAFIRGYEEAYNRNNNRYDNRNNRNRRNGY